MPGTENLANYPVLPKSRILEGNLWVPFYWTSFIQSLTNFLANTLPFLHNIWNSVKVQVKAGISKMLWWINNAWEVYLRDWWLQTALTDAMTIHVPHDDGCWLWSTWHPWEKGIAFEKFVSSDWPMGMWEDIFLIADRSSARLLRAVPCLCRWS